ncbi:hypothetical protein AKJ37_01865 [candidate division MSBL1 archaeon SCGC-AAA259I09]|nr:hypothetical protein AKJ61_00535 [candidate division MSBL1 archaeon SCGC-AAA259B11]KXA97939.1 hypothetical protein AKJ37_01865 [candidate division MSBL1 archaeon SCGC-AAA259I09]
MLAGYFVYIITAIAYYSIFAMALNLEYGVTGLINFGHVAFFGVGAYTAGLLTRAGVSFPLSLLAAMAIAGILGILIAIPTRKLNVHYWAIVTLGVAEVIRLILLSEEWIAKGPFGITIPQAFEGFITGNYPFDFMIVSVILVAITYVIMDRLVNSTHGSILKTIREDDDLPKAFGYTTSRYKLSSMGIGSAFAGMAGVLFAHHMQYLDPSSLLPFLTFLAWIMIIVGGKGNMLGAIVGAVIMTIFYNSTRFLTRFLPGGYSVVASLRMITIGALFLLVLLFKEEGLIPEQKRKIKLTQPVESKAK